MKKIQVNGISFELNTEGVWLVYNKSTIKELLERIKKDSKDANTKLPI